MTGPDMCGEEQASNGVMRGRDVITFSTSKCFTLSGGGRLGEDSGLLDSVIRDIPEHFPNDRIERMQSSGLDPGLPSPCFGG